MHVMIVLVYAHCLEYSLNKNKNELESLKILTYEDLDS